MIHPARQAHPANGSAAAVRFTMQWSGHLGFGEEDHAAGAKKGREAETDLTLRLVIRVDSVDRLIQDPHRHARAGGFVRCHALGGKLPIEYGVCNLLVDEDDPGLRRMRFRVHFRDAVGRPLTLGGFQTFSRKRSLLHDIWPDTTTLFATLIRGHTDEADDARNEIAASGLARLRPVDLVRQLTSFRTQGATRRERYRSLSLFVGFLTRELRAVYAQNGAGMVVRR